MAQGIKTEYAERDGKLYIAKDYCDRFDQVAAQMLAYRQVINYLTQQIAAIHLIELDLWRELRDDVGIDLSDRPYIYCDGAIYKQEKQTIADMVIREVELGLSAKPKKRD